MLDEPELRCPACGYDVSTLGDPVRCPECGRGWTCHQIVAMSRRWGVLRATLRFFRRAPLVTLTAAMLLCIFWMIDNAWPRDIASNSAAESFYVLVILIRLAVMFVVVVRSVLWALAWAPRCWRRSWPTRWGWARWAAGPLALLACSYLATADAPLITRLVLTRWSYERAAEMHANDEIGADSHVTASFFCNKRWITLREGVGGYGYGSFEGDAILLLYIHLPDQEPHVYRDLPDKEPYGPHMQIGLDLAGLGVSTQRNVGFGWWELRMYTLEWYEPNDNAGVTSETR